MAITASTRLVALFGHPVSHSLSPLIHNRGFLERGLPLAYLTFDVEPRRLGDAVGSMRTLGLAGANITIPHKEEVIFFLDSLTERAEAVGAVNTIICRKGVDGSPTTLEGDNTDIGGFVRSMGACAERVKGREALVWGSGGVSRAVIYGLLHELNVSRVHVVCRSDEKGKAIARLFDDPPGRVSVVKWDYATMAMQQATLLVNATPLGMTPDVHSTPCLHPELIRSDHIVCDLVYNPGKTSLLKQAEDAGALCIGGLEMLIGQAAESFASWTGKELPADAVRAELRAAIESGNV